MSFPIICIANAFAWCVGDGAASFLSILAGRSDTENAHKCVGTGITATLMISLVLTVVCEVFNEPLMRLFGAVTNIILAKYGALSIYGQDVPISVFSIQTKVYMLVQNIVTGIVLGGQPIFGDNYESAAANVRRSDEARAAYDRSISGQSWGDPHHYELCVDTSAGRDPCAETIIRFASKA